MFNKKTQGCGGDKVSSWLRFKSNDDTMDFVSNKESTIFEVDQRMVINSPVLIQ